MATRASSVFVSLKLPYLDDATSMANLRRLLLIRTLKKAPSDNDHAQLLRICVWKHTDGRRIPSCAIAKLLVAVLALQKTVSAPRLVASLLERTVMFAKLSSSRIIR